MSRRVVVTGLGAVTPIGNNVDDFWASVKAGKIGFDHITKFDTTDYKCHIAAELKDFNPQDFMDRKAAKRMEPFSQYAVAAAKQAIDDSGLDIEKEDPYMVGCAIGSGVGSLQAMERETQKLYEKGPNRVNPLLVPLMICNMAAGNVSIQLGLRGKCTNVVTACASGTHCIGDAFRAIQYDDADIMFAGGAESSICPTGIAGFQSLTALSTSDDPLYASIPFDKNRKGFVLGEGAGVVVLEELEHAKARGAHIYAEVVGYGATADAFHITSPCEDGSGAAKAMELAMTEAKAAPEEITYINAHGSSTKQNDLYETNSFKKVFGDISYNIPVSSLKSMIGHPLGAASAIEIVQSLLAITNNAIPPLANYNNRDEECDLYYPTEVEEKEVNYVIKTANGFSGIHSAILLGKFSE